MGFCDIHANTYRFCAMILAIRPCRQSCAASGRAVLFTSDLAWAG
jgi:hypothetical protein